MAQQAYFADTVSATDIIIRALKLVGVLGLGQTADAEDLTQAFTVLQHMISQWQRKRWLVYRLEEYSCVSTGAQTYQMGFAAAPVDFNADFNKDFNAEAPAPANMLLVVGQPTLAYIRPNKIEAAFLRQIINSSPNQIDNPMSIIESREQYSDIALKKLQSFSSYVFYDPTWPTGTLYPYPVPTPNIYEIHVIARQTLSGFSDLTTDTMLPPEYNAALYLNLAVRLFDEYAVPPKPITIQLAKESLEVLRTGNAAVPNLKMPVELVRPGIYNPYSDQIR